MKSKALFILLAILLVTKISLGQMPIVNGQQPTAKSYGFYAKASANIAYPIPGIIGSVGYEFNKHFAVGVGGGVVSAAFYDICYPLSIEIYGDITRNNIIGKASLCYSIEPLVLLGTNLYYVLPKIGLRTNNCHFYLTVIGFNFGYKIPFRKHQDL
jgi:hypothetical protein